MENKRVLVIGGTGFVGTRLCKALSVEGYHITAAARKYHADFEELGVEFLEVDLLKVMDVDLSDFDYIFYCAAQSESWSSREEVSRRNLEGLKEVAKAAMNFSVKGLVYSSCSLAEFDKGEVGRTLREAEEFLLELNRDEFQTLVIRSQWIWGEHDKFLLALLNKAKTGTLYHPFSQDVLTDIVHVDNYVYAHELALKGLIEAKDVAGRVYFVGQERPVSLANFFEQIITHSGIDGEVVEYSFKGIRALLTEWAYKILGISSPAPSLTLSKLRHWNVERVFSQDLAVKYLNYHPRLSIEEGLEELFKEKKHRLKLISDLER